MEESCGRMTKTTPTACETKKPLTLLKWLNRLQPPKLLRLLKHLLPLNRLPLKDPQQKPLAALRNIAARFTGAR